MNNSFFSGELVKSNRIIYTPSIFSKNNLIYLQEIGELQAQQPHISKRKNLSSYLFFIVTKGSGMLEYENKVYQLSKGDCVLLDCQKTYAHQSSPNLWELKWIHFYGTNMNNIYDKYLELGGTPSFKTHNTESIMQLWNQIFHFASFNDHTKDMEIYSSLVSLLTLLLNEGKTTNAPGYSAHNAQNLQMIKEYLDTNYSQKITLDLLSNKFYINKFYLERIFKEQFSDTITNYLLKVRITRAKSLLRFTDLSIEKISHECGMNDANYFSRAFKKIEGITPGQFRKMW